jgi:hypothetical protein
VSTHDRVEQRMRSIAHRHIAPEHVEGAVQHYAASAKAAIDRGDLTERQFDCLEWSDHDAAFASIAKSNPRMAAKEGEDDGQ